MHYKKKIYSEFLLLGILEIKHIIEILHHVEKEIKNKNKTFSINANRLHFTN